VTIRNGDVGEKEAMCDQSFPVSTSAVVGAPGLTSNYKYDAQVPEVTVEALGPRRDALDPAPIQVLKRNEHLMRWNTDCCCGKEACDICATKRQQQIKDMLSTYRSISAAIGPIKNYMETTTGIPDAFLIYLISDKLELITAVAESASLVFIAKEPVTHGLDNHKDVLKMKEDMKTLFASLRGLSASLRSISMKLNTSPPPPTPIL
jgi:hypothetical protein